MTDDNLTDELREELTDEIDDMIQRRLSDTLASKGEIADALIAEGVFDEEKRQELDNTPYSILAAEAENNISGAMRVDDGLQLADPGDATANAADDFDDVGTGTIDSGTTATDFTRDAYESGATANADEEADRGSDYDQDLDLDDVGTGVID